MDFLNDKFIRDLADQIRIELVKDGWTPPPDKPDHPREPVRALVDQNDSGGIAFADMLPPASCKRRNIHLIEAGWCQMVKLDWSDKCLVDTHSSCLIQSKSGDVMLFHHPSVVDWRDVTHYAVILPVEG